MRNLLKQAVNNNNVKSPAKHKYQINLQMKQIRKSKKENIKWSETLVKSQ